MIAKLLTWIGWTLVVLTPIASGLLVNFTVAGGYQSATAWLVGSIAVVLGLLGGFSLVGRGHSIGLLTQCRDELARIRYVAELDHQEAEEEEDYDFPSLESGSQ